MAHKITDTCIKCGACEPECEFGAISEGEDQFEIDADLCTDCGACIEANVCPTASIEE